MSFAYPSAFITILFVNAEPFGFSIPKKVQLSEDILVKINLPVLLEVV